MKFQRRGAGIETDILHPRGVGRENSDASTAKGAGGGGKADAPGERER